MCERKAVITGIGVVAPGGPDTQRFWDTVLAGQSSTRLITLFDPAGFRCRIAAECGFDPVRAGLSAQQVRRMDRAAQFAVVALRQALADCSLDTMALAPERIGVSIGNAVGNTMSMEAEYAASSDDGRLWLCDQDYAVPHAYCTIVPSTIATEVAWAVAAEGPVALVSTGCTSGLDAVGYGAQLIEEGSADVVICGGAEAPVSPITVACFDALKATSTRNDEAASACRPFDRERDGLVLGEGAAVLVLEERGHARQRGAHAYCAVSGYAGRANAFHMTGLRPDGRELAEAVRVALDRAQVNADAVDYVSAHGSGTGQNDRHETAALKRSLGQHAYRVPVSSIKSMVGHSLGAIGAIEVAVCALAIEHGAVPPTANLTTPDPELDLDYVPGTGREHRVDVALNLASGFGGFQTAMVLTAPGDQR
jgi:minimal PKS ketosynthase (KS/KS alpha)